MNTQVRTLQESLFPSTPHCVRYPSTQYTGSATALNQLVLLQNQVLQQVVAQSHEIAHLISRIEGCFQDRTRCSSQTSTASSAARSLPETYTLKLVLDGEVASPVLKERGFSLTGSVQDTENQLAVQAAGLQLTLSLYSQDNPTRALTLNIAGQFQPGKKVLRGTVTASVQSDGSFRFPNVVINEVSSHYLDDAFSLVASADQLGVKPLVIRKLAVRARKAKAISMFNATG